jgi:uridine phosphorylase
MRITIPKPRFGEPPVVTPRDSVLSRSQQLSLKLQLPSYFLMSLSVGATSLLVNALNAKEIPWLYTARSLYVGKVGKTPVGVIWAAPGAPLIAVVMEDIIASGARVVIGVGTLGAIQPSIQAGDLIIPSAALRDEGTSYHYLPKDKRAYPTREVLKAIVDSCEESQFKPLIGPVWTTDAPYRETKSKIRHFQRRGVLGVDMETSMIFSMGIYRRIETGCILVAGENLTRPNPPGPFYRDELRKSLSDAVKIGIASVRKLINMGPCAH